VNPGRKKKLLLITGGVFALGVSCALVLFALSRSINLYYTPKQVTQGEVPKGVTFRLGGMVKNHSLNQSQDSLQVSFVLTDLKNHDVIVNYAGILPDLFREGQGIVTQGQLNASGQFVAHEVLAKHDENYMPKVVKDLLNDS